MTSNYYVDMRCSIDPAGHRGLGWRVGAQCPACEELGEEQPGRVIAWRVETPAPSTTVTARGLFRPPGATSSTSSARMTRGEAKRRRKRVLS